VRTGNFWWLAAVIAAHDRRRVVGRTRLQKTVKLLQRLGLPTDYLYTIFFYGPYSEGVFRDIQLLVELGMITEEGHQAGDGSAPYFVLQAKKEATMPELSRFADAIEAMERSDLVVLELAATYDAFREMGADHEEALSRLRHKKAAKWSDEREGRALALLRELALDAE
jgi:uncharacterized protein YwgA